jgi:CRP/FNR family transcriptional regulator
MNYVLVLFHLVLPVMPKSPASATVAAVSATRSSQLLHSVSYLSKLPAPTLAALAAIAIERHYPAGSTIFWEGEPVVGLFVIGEGYVKICRHSAEGREHILHLLHAGETFNDVAAMDGGVNPASAIAYTDATVWTIPRTDLMRVAEQHPVLAWALAESMARRARFLVQKVEDLSMRSVKARLARLLLEQAVQNEAEALPRMLTQEEMANQLGTVREMVGRALRSLADDGVIAFDRHRITILDAERLAYESGS